MSRPAFACGCLYLPGNDGNDCRWHPPSVSVSQASPGGTSLIGHNCVKAEARIAELEAKLSAATEEIEALKMRLLNADPGMWDGVMKMIREALEACGEEMSDTPPYSYDDAIMCAVGKRERKIESLTATLEKAEEALERIADGDSRSDGWYRDIATDALASIAHLKEKSR